MKHHNILLAALTGCILLSRTVPLAAQEVKAGEVRVQKDLEYGTKEGENLKLDLYLPPPKNSRRSVLVLFFCTAEAGRTAIKQSSRANPERWSHAHNESIRAFHKKAFRHNKNGRNAKVFLGV